MQKTGEDQINDNLTWQASWMTHDMQHEPNVAQLAEDLTCKHGVASLITVLGK